MALNDVVVRVDVQGKTAVTEMVRPQLLRTLHGKGWEGRFTKLDNEVLGVKRRSYNDLVDALKHALKKR